MTTTQSSVGWKLSELESRPKNGLKVMSTFSCGGGSSMGYKLAGCDVIAANDIDEEMRWHYVENLKPHRYLLCPIGDLMKQDLDDELFELDILDGSPPCSAFSMSGSRESAWGKEKHFREGQASQVLDDLFFDFLNLVERLKPRAVIAENVKGMLLGNARGYTRQIMRRFETAGYRPQMFLLNAADCGVPQRRERVFFCAVRKDVSDRRLNLVANHPWVTIEAAMVDLPEPTPDELAEVQFTSATDKTWWIRTRPGEGYNDAVVRAGLPSKLWNHRKLDSRRPANTVAGMEMVKHWSEPRWLTFAEWKRIGSFPDDYVAKDQRIGKYMIGMSVPPLMAETVARAVIDQWLQ